MAKYREESSVGETSTSGRSIREAKQVIVIRKELNMRKGKCVAQGSHASVGAVLLVQQNPFDYSKDTREAIDEWMHGQFTKVCVSVDTEAELLDIYQQALDANLPVKLITDSGRTEFHGIPTRTCLAIGPSYSDDLDKITGGLKLL